MKYLLLIFSLLVISSCSISSDKVDYEFSSEVLFLSEQKIKKVLKIEVYSFSEDEGKHFVFGGSKSSSNFEPVKIFNQSEAQETLNLLKKNTGSEENCGTSLVNPVFHFIIRITDSEKTGYFLAQPCSPNSGNTVMISYMYPDGDNAIAYSRSIYEFISKEIRVSN